MDNPWTGTARRVNQLFSQAISVVYSGAGNGAWHRPHAGQPFRGFGCFDRRGLLLCVVGLADQLVKFFEDDTAEIFMLVPVRAGDTECS